MFGGTSWGKGVGKVVGRRKGPGREWELAATDSRFGVLWSF